MSVIEKINNEVFFICEDSETGRRTLLFGKIQSISNDGKSAELTYNIYAGSTRDIITGVKENHVFYDQNKAIDFMKKEARERMISPRVAIHNDLHISAKDFEKAYQKAFPGEFTAVAMPGDKVRIKKSALKWEVKTITFSYVPQEIYSLSCRGKNIQVKRDDIIANRVKDKPFIVNLRIKPRDVCYYVVPKNITKSSVNTELVVKVRIQSVTLLVNGGVSYNFLLPRKVLDCLRSGTSIGRCEPREKLFLTKEAARKSIKSVPRQYRHVMKHRAFTVVFHFWRNRVNNYGLRQDAIVRKQVKPSFETNTNSRDCVSVKIRFKNPTTGAFNELSAGYAFCSPEDTFDYRTGMDLAFNRAVKQVKPLFAAESTFANMVCYVKRKISVIGRAYNKEYR